MEKAYITPAMRVINIGTEGLIAGSDRLEYTTTTASHDTEVLTNRRYTDNGMGIWDNDGIWDE